MGNCQGAGCVAAGGTQTVRARDKKKHRGQTNANPYPALFLQQSCPDILAAESRPPSSSTRSRPQRSPASAPARTSNSVPMQLAPSGSAYSLLNPNMLLPFANGTDKPFRTNINIDSASDYSDDQSHIEECDDIAFVRTYDLFPRQWDYLEEYATTARERTESRAQIDPNEVDQNNAFDEFFDYTTGATIANRKPQDKLLTPTQSFVWYALVNNILDDQERQERIDAAHSVGQLVGRSKINIPRRQTRADISIQPERPDTPTLEKRYGNPLVKPAQPIERLTSVRVKLAARGVPQPQPRLEDPRPDRATRRERMAAHKKARNYTKICGYKLDAVAQWVDSPRDLDL